LISQEAYWNLRPKGKPKFAAKRMRHWTRMDTGTLLWLVVLTVLPLAAALFAGAFGLLDQLGKGGLSLEDKPLPARPASVPSPSDPGSRLEREQEIRQLVEARRDRQLRRGEPPVDVEAEVARLLAIDVEPGSEEERQDLALREEVRQLVIARNERRLARGEVPLDVEAEIDRQLRDIGA
jgi:hypothetical protein